MPKVETPPTWQNLSIRASTEWIDKLDAWRASQAVPPKRADVIRLAVLQFLAKQGMR